MASEKETRDEGEKQEQEDLSEVDEKAIGGSKVEAEIEESEKEADENGEEDEVKDELGEGKRVDENEEDDGKETEEEKPEGSEKKGSRREKNAETGELRSPRTPGSDRPTRERKMVERFKVDEKPRSSASKTLAIEKGRGTQLKDIPNVAFKLSKRKADENLQLLHAILYGKKAKVHTLKKNLGLFSGFIWAENEEKQKLRVKEKIDKCVKEKLLDFCDVLNISLNKASTKKEELVAKLLEFLESPHVTTDALLADKEKSKKRKSKGSASKSHAVGKSTKKQKSESESGKKRKSSTEEEDDKSQPSHSEDDQDNDDNAVPEAESEQEEKELEDNTDKDEDEPKKQKVVSKVCSKKDTGKSGVKSKSASKGSPVEASKPLGKSTKKSSGSVATKGAEAESERKVKSTLTKKQKIDKESEKDTTKGTSSSKKKSKSSNKVLDKDEDDDKKEPTKEDMHAAVVDILKEVDFNTATLSDILKQLGNHFGLDLIHRKAEVKDIITEVIKNMSDDDDGSGDESGKDEDDET